MTPKWQKLASLAQEICTLWFQFFGAVFASKGYPFKNIFVTCEDQPAHRTILLAPLFLEQNIKDFVGPDLGPNCLLN